MSDEAMRIDLMDELKKWHEADPVLTPEQTLHANALLEAYAIDEESLEALKELQDTIYGLREQLRNRERQIEIHMEQLREAQDEARINLADAVNAEAKAKYLQGRVDTLTDLLRNVVDPDFTKGGVWRDIGVRTVDLKAALAETAKEAEE